MVNNPDCGPSATFGFLNKQFKANMTNINQKPNKSFTVQIKSHAFLLLCVCVCVCVLDLSDVVDSTFPTSRSSSDSGCKPAAVTRNRWTYV